MKICDVRGIEVKSVTDEPKSAGEFTVRVDLSNFAPGIYFYKLTANGQTTTGKIVLIK